VSTPDRMLFIIGGYSALLLLYSELASAEDAVSHRATLPNQSGGNVIGS
jgi:hypothetical protein